MRKGRPRRENGDLGITISVEIEAEADRPIGDGVPDSHDFEAIETAAGQAAPQITGQAIAQRLDADHSDGQRGNSDATNSTGAASAISSPSSRPMPKPARKSESAPTTSPEAAPGCGTRSSAPWGRASRPGASKPAARTSSQPASIKPERTGPSTAPTPSSHRDAPSSATASATPGNGAPPRYRNQLTILTYTPRRLIAQRGHLFVRRQGHQRTDRSLSR